MVEKNPGAIVHQALLFAASTGFTGYTPINGDVTIDGAPVTWDPTHTIGNSISSFNVLADVTEMVKAKLDAASPGPVSFTIAEPNNTLQIDGEILAVIFDDPTVTINKSITLLYGAQSTTGDTFNVALTAPIDKSDPNQQLAFGLGISYGYQAAGILNQYSLIDVNSTRISSAAGGQDDCDQKYAAAPNFASCGNGSLLTVGGTGDSTSNPVDPNATPQDSCVPRCDDELYNLEPFVNSGDTAFTIHTLNPSNDDNIFFAWLLANPPATVTSGNCSPTAAPTIDSVIPSNGGATVTWEPVTATSGCAITNYVVTAMPLTSDRIPAPSIGTPSIVCPGDPRCSSPTSATFSNLLMDCHQRYAISVYAEDGALVGPPATSDGFRPSGIVVQGKAPPYVVILLDGIAESQPGFTMDPYAPTLDGNPSYCPESWSASTNTEAEADFAGAPNGPWSFFHKWNFGEVDSNGNATGNDESAPRAVPGNAQGLAAGTYTHSFMLDAIAAQGAIILPFSYKGFGFGRAPNNDPLFTYYGYALCQSTPGCGPTVQQDASLLAGEVNSAAAVWPTAKIIVMGHSQGGLVAFEWWACSQVHGGDCRNVKSTLPSSFVHAFSLDSPINGACGAHIPVVGPCLGPPSYPPYELRVVFDPAYLLLDASQGEQFRFIGTYGDSPLGGYQSGSETLEHQMLFNYCSGGFFSSCPPSSYSTSQIESLCADPNNEAGCPAGAPDHISDCPVNLSTSPAWENAAAHYVEKFCPGNINYFNKALGLAY
jgi:hypothetical protein